LCLRVGQRGYNVGTRWQQQDIIEGERLRNGKMNHILNSAIRVSLYFRENERALANIRE